MALPLLVDDIYYEILQALDARSDISAFMFSSWRFYSLGVDRLLQKGAIIYTEDQLVSFCHFMTRNFLDVRRTANQLTYLMLSILSDTGYFSDHDSGSELPLWDIREEFEPFRGASLLVPVLGCMTNLKALLLDSCELLLRSDTRLVEAFAALTTLEELRIRYYGLLTCDLVDNLQSTLLYLDIGLRYTACGYIIENDANEDRVDPLSVLSRHHNTLKKAVIHHGDLTPWLQEVHPRTVALSFPAVHTLAFTTCRALQRDVIVRAFPNVTYVQMLVMLANSLGTPGVNLTLDEVRDINSNSPVQWNNLRHVVGDVDSLHMLALYSPHTITVLDVICWAFDEDAVERLHAIIESLRPRNLLLAWGYWDTLPQEPWTTKVSPEQLEVVFASPTAECLEDIGTLALDVRLTSLDLDALGRYMDAILNLVTSLPNIRAFSFRLERSTDSAHNQEVEVEPPEDAAADIARTFNNEGLTLWAVRLAEAVQSLERILFCVMGHHVGWWVEWPAGARGMLHPIDTATVQHLVETQGTIKTL